MGEQRFGEEVQAALGTVEAALDRLTGLPPLTQDQLLGLVRRFEVFRRRMPVLDHALVWELEARSVADSLGARSTAVLLRDLLRLSPSEAAGRVAAARRLGQRETLTGQVLVPEYPVVAAAQVGGRPAA